MAGAQRTFELLRGALQSRDADDMLELYSEDAVMLGYDENRPPSSPMRLEGKTRIEPVVRDNCSRDMTHQVGDEVVGEDRFSFNEICEYSDGSRMFASIVCDLRDGKITREVRVQVRDE